MTRVVNLKVTEVILIINHTLDVDTSKEWMKYEKNRRYSFDPIWLEHYELDATFAHELARAGFYCVPEGGDSVCFSCGLRKSSFFWGERRGDPKTFHREQSPDCEFVNDTSENVPIDSEQQNNLEFVYSLCTSTDYGEIAEVEQIRTPQVAVPPKHPEYESESKRMSTFTAFGMQSVEDLVEAGFYFTGNCKTMRKQECITVGCIPTAHSPYSRIEGVLPFSEKCKTLRHSTPVDTPPFGTPLDTPP